MEAEWYGDQHQLQDAARSVSRKTGIDEKVCYTVLSSHYGKLVLPAWAADATTVIDTK
jgi:hypothetical protein